MRTSHSSGGFLFVGSALFFLFVAAGSTLLQAAENEPFARRIDAIQLVARNLPSLLTLPIVAIRLAAWKHGVLTPIPFQIDENDAQGVYIFRTSHPDHEDQDCGHFDENDEFVFMARDLGDRLPGGRTRDKNLLAEIEVTNPLDGTKGWAYVGTEAFCSGLCPRDYVTYDPESDRILAENYRLGFSREAPISYGDTTVTTKGGGNNSRINERVVTRMQATFLKVFKLARSEEDFRSSRKGYIDGPVRVIKRVGNSMRQVFGIYGPEVVVDYTFYTSHWIMPSIIDLPVDVGKFVSRLSLRAGTDWTRNASGMVFYTKYIHPGVAVIDGHMSEVEKRMDLGLDIRDIWHCYTGAITGSGQGSILFRILMDDRLTDKLQAETYFYDTFYDPDHREDPYTKDEYNRFFEGSYVWKGIEKVSKGRYFLTSWAAVMPDYKKPGDEQGYLDILDNPLSVKVRTFAGKKQENGL